MIRPPKTILLVNIRLIGDVILTTPLIGLLHMAYPDASIDLLVNLGTAEFTEKDDRVRNVIYSDKWRNNTSGLNSGYLTKIFRKYDLAVSMNAGDRGAVAILFAGRYCRVGYYEQPRPLARFFRNQLFNHPLLFDEDQHVVLRCSQIAEALGIPCERLEVKLFWDEPDRCRVVNLLADGGLSGPYLVIHPFARWRYKYWEIIRFCEVSDRLARDHGLQPVWTSSPDPEEIALLQTAAMGCGIKPLLIPGTLSLNQMACLLKGAALYIGLDTAITHIAASTGVPMLALYGPTELWRWHPWDNEHSLHEPVTVGYRGTIRSGQMVTLQAGCEHYPCIRPHCYGERENPCMMAITAEQVCQEALHLLAAGSAVTRQIEKGCDNG